MKFHVEYRDGGAVDYDVLPIHLLDYEEQVGALGASESISSSFRLAYIATEADTPFRDWLRGVKAIEVTGVEAAPADAEPGGEPVPTSTP